MEVIGILRQEPWSCQMVVCAALMNSTASRSMTASASTKLWSNSLLVWPKLGRTLMHTCSPAHRILVQAKNTTLHLVLMGFGVNKVFKVFENGSVVTVHHQIREGKNMVSHMVITNEVVTQK